MRKRNGGRHSFLSFTCLHACPDLPWSHLASSQDTVEDVDVHPSSDCVLCSVGDDRLVAFWDSRDCRTGPVTRVDGAHTADINSCAWNPVETNYVLTGSSDGTTHL